MRYPIRGQVYPDSVCTVRHPGTTDPATIYAASAGGAALTDAEVSAASDGSVVFYVDADTYPILSLFDILIETPGYGDVTRSDVWSFFSIIGALEPAAVDLPYSLSNMRTRLAVWARVEQEVADAQVKAVLDECIQTAYEKTVSMINLHARQTQVTLETTIGGRLYTGTGIGIPTYVGYKTRELEYVPMEILRTLAENFNSDLDVGDPLYYSLYGFDGQYKTVSVWPTPKEVDSLVFLCLQIPTKLTNDNDFPLVPPEWMWIVLERAKIERLGFEARKEEYALKLQEHTALLKVMMTRVYPATPNKQVVMGVPSEQANYQAWRMSR